MLIVTPGYFLGSYSIILQEKTVWEEGVEKGKGNRLTFYFLNFSFPVSYKKTWQWLGSVVAVLEMNVWDF